MVPIPKSDTPCPDFLDLNFDSLIAHCAGISEEVGCSKSDFSIFF